MGTRPITEEQEGKLDAGRRRLCAPENCSVHRGHSSSKEHLPVNAWTQGCGGIRWLPAGILGRAWLDAFLPLDGQ